MGKLISILVSALNSFLFFLSESITDFHLSLRWELLSVTETKSPIAKVSNSSKGITKIRKEDNLARYNIIPLQSIDGRRTDRKDERSETATRVNTVRLRRPASKLCMGVLINTCG